MRSLERKKGRGVDGAIGDGLLSASKKRDKRETFAADYLTKAIFSDPSRESTFAVTSCP